jgi:taurine transport system ATP-binding protein
MSKLEIRNVSVNYAGSAGRTDARAVRHRSRARSRRFRRRRSARRAAARPTLLSCIAGFMEPSEGTIVLDGQPVRGPGAERGVVFQKHALMPWLDVVENVEFGLRMRGVPKAERHAIALDKLRLVGLEKFARHPVYQISGGMQQRVGLARALASDPEVMLMDEPMGALDALTREQMQELILELWWKTRKMFFFITHSVEEALFLATELIVMTPSPGRIAHRYRVDFGRPLHRHARRARRQGRRGIHPPARGDPAADPRSARRTSGRRMSSVPTPAGESAEAAPTPQPARAPVRTIKGYSLPGEGPEHADQCGDRRRAVRPVVGRDALRLDPRHLPADAGEDLHELRRRVERRDPGRQAAVRAFLVEPLSGIRRLRARVRHRRARRALRWASRASRGASSIRRSSSIVHCRRSRICR